MEYFKLVRRLCSLKQGTNGDYMRYVNCYIGAKTGLWYLEISKTLFKNYKNHCRNSFRKKKSINYTKIVWN